MTHTRGNHSDDFSDTEPCDCDGEEYHQRQDDCPMIGRMCQCSGKSGEVCFHEKPLKELDEEAKKIPAVSHRELYMRTCDMMYSHYKILHIVDFETALRIIRRVLDTK